MHQLAAHVEGAACVAGARRAVQPLGLPALTLPSRSPRKPPLGGMSAPWALKRRSAAVLMAAAATEKTMEAEKRNAQANGVVKSKSTTLPSHVEWYKQNKELWCEAQSNDELQKVLSEEQDKIIVVDFYAGWCSSCKAAYPALCKVAGSPDFTKDFKFVKADVQKRDIAQFIRTQGVKGIPTIIVFAPGGKKLAHFGASFRKMNMVKANLVVIAVNKGAEFVTDPEGFVMPRPASN